MYCEKYRISESDNGWHVSPSDREFSTAPEALRFVDEQERLLTTDEGIRVAVIEWTAFSRVGKAMVAVLTQTP